MSTGSSLDSLSCLRAPYTHKTTFEFGGHAISAGISWNNVWSSPNGTLKAQNNFSTEMASPIVPFWAFLPC